MFQNKNFTNLSQEKDLPFENVPIHTMEQDMSETKKPESSTKSDVVRETSPKPTSRISQEKLTEIQKSSPFLKPAEPGKPVQTENESKKDYQATEPGKSVRGSGKFLNFALAGFAILTFSAGAYYFMIIRQPESSDLIVETPKANETPDQKNQDSVDYAQISETTTNYFNLDQNSSALEIREKMEEIGKTVAESNFAKPVEFMIVDSQNNPIDFKTFAEKLDIPLSTEILSDLGENFLLYVNNDSGKPRIGIIASLLNAEKAKSDLLQEEAMLANKLKNLFLTQDYVIDNKDFNSSQYKNFEIRYINVMSPEPLSIDYSITSDKLYFGTSKNTLRALLDK